MRRFLVVLLLSLVSQETAGSWESNIFVSPNGRDSPSCGRKLEPCRSLHHAYDLGFRAGFNSTFITLGKGRYVLRKSLTFQRVQHFGFGSGSEDSTSNEVDITCAPNVSIAFFLSRNVTLRGFKLSKCGGWQDSDVHSQNSIVYKFRTALHFVYCRNVLLSNVKLSASNGRAANFYQVGGVVNVTNSCFENSSSVATEERTSTGIVVQKKAIIKYISTGGGIFLSLNKYDTRIISSLVTPSEHDTYLHGNTYIFKNCHFLRNEVPHIDRKEFYPDDFPETFNRPFSHGGGLSIFFRGNASGSSIHIQDSKFLANRALCGGGLQVEFANSSQNNTLSVERTVFDSNVGDLSGGGARVGNMLTKGISVPMNAFYFANCSFMNNWGTWGGGVSVYGTTIFCNCKHSFSSRRMFTFKNCHWLGNRGTTGSAVGAYLFNQNDDQIGPEVPFHVELDHCLFESNEVVVKELNVRIGEGAIYSLEVPIVFRGNTSIVNNTYTALAVDGATLEVHDNVVFERNRGFRGGAIAMYGRSKIVLTKKSRLLFKRNACKDRGGAMYIYASGPPQVNFGATGNTSHTCFFAYEDPRVHFDDWDTQVIFQDNEAAADEPSGHSVYATTLKNCRTAEETQLNNSVLAWRFIKYITTTLPDLEMRNIGVYQAIRPEIVTAPVDIKYTLQEWNVAPDELFNATVQLLDEKGNSVYGIVNVVVNSDQQHGSSLVSLRTPSPLFLANDKISSLSLKGKVSAGFSVTLQHVGRQVLNRLISNVSLKSCHPGFSPKDRSCVCSEEEGISRCDDDGKTFYLRRGFWGGTVDGKFAIARCPPTYCNCSGNRLSPLLADGECSFIPQEMCDGDREGTLCGKCKPGYSVVLGSSSCHKCGWYGYLILLPVYLVILLALVMLVMLLNLDAFTGSLNASLYSYQVMLQLLGEGFESPDPFMQFIINVFNFQLKLGNHICISSNLDDADKLFIELSLPALMLLLVMVFIKVVGRYPKWCLSRKVKAPFQAICTMSVLCYTAITLVCLIILRPAKVGDKTVLFVSGNTEFFKGKHIVYGVVAIFFMVFFVVPFPLILMFRPFFTRFLRPVFNLNNLKPIFDVLQSCFKDQYRWFAAFYFVCRLVLLVIATYVPSGPVKRTLLEISCNMILFIFAYLRPYKKSKANNVDALLLFNLSAIAVFSSATENNNILKRNKSAMTVLVSILAYVPLLVLAWYALRKVKRCCADRFALCMAEDDEPDEPMPSETTAWVAPLGPFTAATT